MKKRTRPIAALWLAIIVVGLAVGPVYARGKRVQAKVGIKLQSADQLIRARSRNFVKPGALIRIYVHPQEDVYVYVVHSDGKTATLLNMTMQKVQSTLLTLPSMSSFYKVDGSSPMEKITIVCSPSELPRLSEMIDRDRPDDQWTEIEDELVSRSTIVLAGEGEVERAFGIAGNVRGTESYQEPDSFVKELPIYSGAGLLVKKYEFMVQE